MSVEPLSTTPGSSMTNESKMTKPTEETIVCFSSQRWRDEMWTNKQHVMSRLADDHRVVHVDYGLRWLPLYLAERALYHRERLWPPHRMLYDGVAHEEGNLYIGDSYSPLSAGLFRHGHPIRDLFTFDAKVWMVKRFLAKNASDNPIVWVYHPGFGDAVERMKRKLLVYDCVDNYEAFPTYRGDPQWLMEREKRLCERADVVFCTSRSLYESRRAYNPDNTYLVHNVGDAEHFGQAMDPELEVATEIDDLQGPVVGFVGAVSDYKLNIDWIARAARARPGWQFALIGPVGMADPGTEVGELKSLRNVHLLGYRAYEDLPRYLKGMDVTVIPYRINEYTESVFPIKFFEFMATGKPVVISRLPALREYYDAVEVADNADELVAQCDAALNSDEPEARRRRVELARQNSWKKRVRKMWEKVEERIT